MVYIHTYIHSRHNILDLLSEGGAVKTIKFVVFCQRMITILGLLKNDIFN